VIICELIVNLSVIVQKEKKVDYLFNWAQGWSRWPGEPGSRQLIRGAKTSLK